MKKNSITNKITPCCLLPFGVAYWWVSNLTLNSEADRQFIISKIHQNGMISIDAWKVLINSGTLEADSALTKAEYLAWFNCSRQPSCDQLTMLIEGFKVGNYNPLDEYGVGWTEISSYETFNNKIIKKVTNYVGGVGPLPSELSDNIGKYYAALGGFTTDKNLATDFKAVGSANPNFDATNNLEAPTMKAVSDRYDKAQNSTIIRDIQSFKSSDVEMYKTTIDNGVLNMVGLDAGVLITETTLHEDAESSIVYSEVTASNLLFGFRAINTRHHVTFKYNTNGANFGKLEIVAKNPLVSIKVSSESNTNYAIGDVLKLTVKRKGLKYIFQVFNATKNWSLRLVQDTTPLGVPFIAHSSSNPFISVTTASSSVKVFSYKKVSNSRYIDSVMLGDSITFGQSGAVESERWASLVKGNNLVMGGGADTTGYVKGLVDEIIKINPKRVLLMIGINDVAFGVPESEWKQNLRDIRSNLVNKGIEVVHCLSTPTPYSSQVINFITSEPTFKNDVKINTNTPLSSGDSNTLAPIYNSGDGVHPNVEGHAKIAEIVNLYNASLESNYVETFKQLDDFVLDNSDKYLQKSINNSISDNSTEDVKFGHGTNYTTISNANIWIANKINHPEGKLKKIIFNALHAENYRFVVATLDTDNKKVTFSNTYINHVATVGINEVVVPNGITLLSNQTLFLSVNTSGKIGYSLNGAITDCNFIQTNANTGVNDDYTDNGAGFMAMEFVLEVKKGKEPFTVLEMMNFVYDGIHGTSPESNENLDFNPAITIDKTKSFKYTKLTGLQTFTKSGESVIDKYCIFKLTGGNISFTSDFLALENSKNYNPAMTNIIKFFKEYNKIRYTNEVLPLEPI